MVWIRPLSAFAIIGLAGAGTVSASASGARAAQGRHHVVHGVIEKAQTGKKGGETLTLKVHQRPGAQAAAGTSHEVTFHLASHTKLMNVEHANGKTTHTPAKIEDLKTGEHVTVMGDPAHPHIAAAVMIGHHAQKAI